MKRNLKEFVIKELGQFIEVSDSISTPFKFYEVDEVGKEEWTLNAKVWLRTAFIAFEENTHEKEKLEAMTKTLEDHGFVLTEIRESPLVLR